MSICKEALNGVKRVLAHLEMLNSKNEVPQVLRKSIFIHETHWMRADFSGFLHVKTNLHDFVTKD